MIIEAGRFALACVLGASLAQGGAVWLGSRFGVRAAWLASASAGVALVALVVAFMRLDFSAALVAAHAHAGAPAPWRLVATWANHEGSLLVWIVALACLGALVARRLRALPENEALTNAFCAIHGVVVALFVLYALATSDPFARLVPVPWDGAGLNPLLRDIALAVHPVALYWGLSGFAAGASLATAALWVGGDWVATARRATRWSWAWLTIALALGSWWAAREPGWGGFWFWDPVENAGLAPWLLGLAALHTLARARGARGGFAVVSAGLLIAAWSMALLGSWVTRSGSLESIHAFASDPTRGIALAILAALVIAAMVWVLVVRWQGMAEGGGKRRGRHDTAAAWHVVIALTATLGLVLGIFAPLVMEAMGQARAWFSADYYVRIVVPLGVAAVVGAGFASRLSRSGVVLAAGLALAVLLGAAWAWGDRGWLGVVAAAAGAWLVGASLAGRGLSFVARWAHVGMGVAAMGLALAGGASSQRSVDLRLGESFAFDGVRLTLVRIETEKVADWVAVRVVLRSQDGQEVAPSTRLYSRPRTNVGETDALGVAPLWLSEARVYVSPSAAGAWRVSVAHAPGIRLIWFGVAIMALAFVAGGVRRGVRRIGVRRGVRRVARLALAAVLVGAVAGVAGAGWAQQDRRIDALLEDMRCPTCAGQSARHSNAPLALAMRAYVEERARAGASDTQIRAAIAERYGDEALAVFSGSGWGWLWLAPLALAGGAFALWRRRRS